MDEKEIGLEVWRTTIDVQKHFNEICIKIRSIGVTVLGGFLAVAGYSIKEGNWSLAGSILFAAMLCWIAFYLMDRVWYHTLLQSAVIHGEQVEKDLGQSIPNIGLTTRLKADSHAIGTSAAVRLSYFYLVIGAVLGVGSVVLLQS